MVDNRFATARSIYSDAVHRFLLEDMGNFYIKEHNIPIAHLGTVLSQVFKNRETYWKSCKEGPKAETLNPLQKEETHALIVDGLKYGAFFRMPKRTLQPEEKTFQVAFPGFDVSSLPAFRKKAI